MWGRWGSGTSRVWRGKLLGLVFKGSGEQGGGKSGQDTTEMKFFGSRRSESKYIRGMNVSKHFFVLFLKFIHLRSEQI